MKSKQAFTLIELLVVISIIALLVSILMPALNRAKEQAKASVCLGNQKALISAWIMYQVDNDDKLVGGIVSSYDSTANASYWGGALDYPAKISWAHAPLRSDLRNATKDDLISTDGLNCRKRGVEYGKLWKYTKTHDVYNCPGDRKFKNNPPYDTFVSYAISATMNGEEHTWNGNIKPYINNSQIKIPTEKMVFIEENPIEQEWLAGSFVLDSTGSTTMPKLIWRDYPAPWHIKKATVSFADGHAQTTDWKSKTTRELVMHETRMTFSIGDEFCADNLDLFDMNQWYGGR